MKKSKRMMDGGMARPGVPMGRRIPVRGMDAAPVAAPSMRYRAIPSGIPMTRPGMMVGTPRKLAMKGGGLARKGVGMALAKGGLAKANGCAKRGKTRGKMM